MTQEEIKELIRQELKEKLQITIDTERVVFTNDTNVEVSIIYDGNIVSSEYFTIHNYQPLSSAE